MQDTDNTIKTRPEFASTINRNAALKVGAATLLTATLEELNRRGLYLVPQSESHNNQNETFLGSNIHINPLLSAASVDIQTIENGLKGIQITNPILCVPEESEQMPMPDVSLIPYPPPVDIIRIGAGSSSGILLPEIALKLEKFATEATGKNILTLARQIYQNHIDKDSNQDGLNMPSFNDIYPLMVLFGYTAGELSIPLFQKVIKSLSEGHEKASYMMPSALIDPLGFFKWYANLGMEVRNCPDVNNFKLSDTPEIQINPDGLSISKTNVKFTVDEEKVERDLFLTVFPDASDLELNLMNETMGVRLDYAAKINKMGKIELIGFPTNNPSRWLHTVPNYLTIRDKNKNPIAVTSATWADSLAIHFTEWVKLISDESKLDPLFRNVLQHKLFAISPNYWRDFSDEEIAQIITNYNENPIMNRALNELLCGYSSIKSEAPQINDFYERVYIKHPRFNGITSSQVAEEFFLASSPDEIRQTTIFRPGGIYTRDDDNIPDRAPNCNLSSINVLLLDGNGKVKGHVTFDQNYRFQPRQIKNILFDSDLLMRSGLNPADIYAMALDEHGGGGIIIRSRN